MIDRRAFLGLLASAALMPLTACGGSGSNEAQTAETEQNTQIPNPFVDCDSAYEAAQLAGFDVTFPESVPGYSQRRYQAIEGEMVQCIYSEGEASVLIRKGVDDGSGDISGDYNEYDEETVVSVGDIDVTERGNDGLVYVATWTKDSHAFAIDADEGLEAEVIENLVTTIL